MRLLLILALFVLTSISAFAETPAETAEKRQLVTQYLSEARFTPLYEKIIGQYQSFVPASRQAQAQALTANPDFRHRIFDLVQQRAVNIYTLPEAQAVAKFMDTPQGEGIVSKVNERGMSFRNSDLSPDELQALQNFHATPLGQQIAKKNTTLVSGALSEVFKTFLLYQPNLQ